MPDYIACALTEQDAQNGPFFVQVKTTSRMRPNRTGYPIAFSVDDVKRAQEIKATVLRQLNKLFGTRTCKILIKGLESGRIKAIATLAADHDLATDAVKLDLYRERGIIWTRRSIPWLRKL